MAKIIMIGNQKGGIGKTAVTVMAATAISQAPFNLKTAIVDLDNQKSVVNARKFDKKAYEVEAVPFEVLNYSIEQLQNNIAQLDNAFDVVFLDVAGKLDNLLPIESQEISKALMYVDRLFIPFVSGSYILESTIEYFRFIKRVQLIRALQPRTLKVFGFINMFRPRTKANNFLAADIATLQATENLVMLENKLNDYALFRESDTIVSLYDAHSTDSAKSNFAVWLIEFIKLIQ